MLRFRVIPVLLISEDALVKGNRFKQHRYVGDPINAIKIFNEKGCDELILLDISTRKRGLKPDFEQIRGCVEEAFMPVAYGGGINTLSDIKNILALGVEKIILNTAAYREPSLVSQASNQFGSQSIVVAVDYKQCIFGRKPMVFVENGRRAANIDVEEACKRFAALGAGEIILSSIVREGMGTGYDTQLLKRLSHHVAIPTVALNGAGSFSDIIQVAADTDISGAAAGSLFVFHGPHKAVLITYPSEEEISSIRRGSYLND